jgi:chromosome segregation ATPase
MSRLKNKQNTKDKKKNKIDNHYVAALLEDLRSQFRIFGEGLEFVREKGEATFNAVGELQEQVSDLKLKVNDLSLKTDWLQSGLKSVKIEIANIKLELAEIKKLLTRKVDIERLESLERRVTELENLILAK